MSDEAQRHCDEQRGRYDASHSDYIPTLGFIPACHSFAAPAPVTTPLRHVSAALLGTKAERDAFAQVMLQREREYEEAMALLPEQMLKDEDVEAMALQDEINSEGRRPRPFPVNFHE